MDEASLTPEQQAVLREVDEFVVFIPERKSPEMTEELWQKRQILKGLVYKDLIQFDVDFNSRRWVFYSKNGPGKLPDSEIWPDLLFV